MADEEIEIKLEATGGDQAAEEINKVGDASQETGKKVAAMEDQPAPSKAVDRVTRLKEVAAATGAIGIAAGFAKQTLSNVWEELDKIDTVELKKLDSAWADQIDNAKKFRDALQDPIGALVALANGGTTIKEAFADLDAQMKLNAEVQSSAVDRLLAKSETQTDKIKRLAEDIKAANELLEAKITTARTIRDGQNDEAIRKGADKDDVAAAEAYKRAEEDIALIEAEQNGARAGLQQKYEAAMESQRKADQAKAAAGKIDTAAANADSTEAAYKSRSPDATPDEVWAMRNSALSARSDYEYTKRAYQPQAEAAAALQKKAEEDFKAFEDEKTGVGRVDALAAERKAQIRAGRDNRVREAEASKVTRRAEAEEQAAGKAGRDAEQLLPPGASAELKDAVRSVSRRLQDGDQGGELSELAGLLKEMGNSLAAKDAQRAKDIAALKQEIGHINQRGKNR